MTIGKWATALLGIGIIAAAYGVGHFCVEGCAEAAQTPLPVQAPVPVVVELFSSEGCSSCPPADAFLADLERTQPAGGVTIVALEEHVDYWDYLGWRDPFGHERFSDRQRQYSATLSDSRVFTPEMVVDGHTLIDRSDKAGAVRALQASARGPKARIALSRRGDRVGVDIGDVPPGEGAAEVWMAITESGLSTRVERGENAGRVLAHAPIVRALRKIGTVSGGAFRGEAPLSLEAGWKPEALRTVVFVQRASSRRILGAAAM